MGFKKKDNKLNILKLCDEDALLPTSLCVLKGKRPVRKEIKGQKPSGDWDIIPYPNLAMFECMYAVVADIETLESTIKALAESPYYFPIMGKPSEAVINNYVNRLNPLDIPEIYRRSNDSEAGPRSIMEMPGLFLPIDVDTMTIEGYTTNKAGAKKALKKLCEDIPELTGVSCVYQHTTKAGMTKDAVKIRFYFLLDTPTLPRDIKAWLKNKPIDRSIYGIVQPIYTANPYFNTNAVANPIPDHLRIGSIIGDLEFVSVPTAHKSKTADIEKLHKTSFQDKLATDPILHELFSKDMVKAENEKVPGTFNLNECPWADSHTDGQRTGAAYFAPHYNNRKSPGFSCFHDHCREHNIHSLKAFLGIRMPHPNDKSQKDPKYAKQPKNEEAAECGTVSDRFADPVFYEDIDRFDTAFDTLKKRFIYVMDQESFYDMCSHRLYKKEAVDNMYRAHYNQANGLLGVQLLNDMSAIKTTSMIYLPGESPIVEYNNELCVNIYNRLGTPAPIPGAVEIWTEHMEYLFPDEVEREHLYSWLAFCLQNPAIKINYAVLVAGISRNGKDSAFEPFKRAMGIKNVREIAAVELKETYTDFLMNTKLVVIQEAQNFDKASIENKLKPILASPPEMLRIRMFGKGFFETPNIVQGLFFSNHYNALKISEGDGRYYALWCGMSPQSATYYQRYWDFINDTGTSHIMYWLLDRDISEFNPYDSAPQTAYKRGIQDLSLSNTERGIKHMIETFEPPFHRDMVDIHHAVSSGQIQHVSEKSIAIALADMHCERKRIKHMGKLHSVWCIRNQSKWAKKSPRWWYEELKARGTKNDKDEGSEAAGADGEPYEEKD